MKSVVTYVNPKLKKLVSGIVLVTSVGTIFLSGCGVNKNGNEEVTVNDDTSVSSMNDENLESYDYVVQVNNYEYCNNSAEFLAFIAEDGRIISTVPVGEGNYDVSVPGATKYVYSPVLDIEEEINELNDNNEIIVDYKDKTIEISKIEKSIVR